MIKFGLNKQNIAIILGLIALFLILTYFAMQLVSHKEVNPYVFQCNEQRTIFRANISSCFNISVSPSDRILTDTLTSPVASGVVLLIDPNETGTGVSVYEIYKIYYSLQKLTGKNAGVAYTQPWLHQPNIPVMSIDNASFSAPIIWLRQNQTETKIFVDGPRIYVNAKSQHDLDAAACRISILVIKKVMEC